MFDSVRPHRRQPTRLPRPWDSPGKNTGVGCHFLLQSTKVKVKLLSRVRLFETPWTTARQAPLSMGFSRREYRSGVPSSLAGDLPDPGIESCIGRRGFCHQRHLGSPKVSTSVPHSFVFGCARSSLLHGPFSSSGDGGACSSCSAPASHCSDFVSGHKL